MRYVLAAFAMLSWPVLAGGQTPAPDRGSALGPIGLPLTAISSPLGPIGLPLAPIGLPPRTDSPTRGRSNTTSRTDRPTRNGAQRPDRGRPAVVYVMPPYYAPELFAPAPGIVVSSPAPANATPVAAPAPAPAPSASTGSLRLDLGNETRGAQVFVDGYFVGTMEDLGGQLALESGNHQVEIRAEQYEPLAIDVRMGPDRSLSYRGTMRPLTQAAPTPASNTTIYFIPGCYLGNVPPQQAALPTSCDLSRLSTYKP